MHPHQTPLDLVELAAAHLRTAALDAVRRSNGDVFSPWHAYAGQLDLTAEELSRESGPIPQVDDHAGLLAHLHCAARALARVPAGDGPPQVALWCWHVEQLRVAAEEMAAA